MPRASRRSFLLGCAGAWGWAFLEDLSRATATPASRAFFERQEQRRQELWDLLGDLPPRDRPVTARLLSTSRGDGYTLEHLELDANGIEPVPALLLLPDKRAAKAPGLVYIHAHGGTYELGKEELIRGRAVLPAYAPVCAEKGIVTLAIDSWCFSAAQAQGGWAAGRNRRLQGDAVARPRAVGHDDVRRSAGRQLSGRSRRSRSGADRRLRAVDGLDQGLVAGRARSAREALRRSVLPDRLRRADQDRQSARPRHLLLRARGCSSTFKPTRSTS